MKIQYQACVWYRFYKNETYDTLHGPCDTFEEALEEAKEYVRSTVPEYFEHWLDEDKGKYGDEKRRVSVFVRVVGDYRAWL